MKQKINKAITATNGKKTESMGVLMVAFQILMVLKPDLISTDVEKALNIAISSGAISAVGHRIWRNRKKYGNYIADNFKRLKNGFKKQNREGDRVGNDIPIQGKSPIQEDKVADK